MRVRVGELAKDLDAEIERQIAALDDWRRALCVELDLACEGWLNSLGPSATAEALAEPPRETLRKQRVVEDSVNEVLDVFGGVSALIRRLGHVDASTPADMTSWREAVQAQTRAAVFGAPQEYLTLSVAAARRRATLMAHLIGPADGHTSVDKVIRDVDAAIAEARGRRVAREGFFPRGVAASACEASLVHQAKTEQSRIHADQEAAERVRLAAFSKDPAAGIAQKLTEIAQWRDDKVLSLQLRAEERLAQLGSDPDPEEIKKIRRELKEDSWGANAVVDDAQLHLGHLAELVAESGVVSLKLVRAMDAWWDALQLAARMTSDLARERIDIRDPVIMQAYSDAASAAMVRRLEMYAADPAGEQELRDMASNPDFRAKIRAAYAATSRENHVDFLEAQMHWDFEEAVEAK